MVHLDYNNHLGDNDAVRAKKHKDAVLGAASRYNYPASILFDDQSKLAAAVDHLAKVINESTSSSPLKLICAGPMEVCWQGLKKSDPSKHQYVTVISHSSWNDNHADTPQMSHRWKNITKDFKVKAEHIGDQNATAFKSTPSAWSWLKTTQGGTWLYTIVSTDEKAGDASDTGMVMYALNGNQKATMAQIRSYMGY